MQNQKPIGGHKDYASVLADLSREKSEIREIFPYFFREQRCLNEFMCVDRVERHHHLKEDQEVRKQIEKIGGQVDQKKKYKRGKSILVLLNQEQQQINNLESRQNELNLHRLSHKCICLEQCLFSFCPCSNNLQEPCIEGQCCEGCVKKKKEKLEIYCQNCKNGQESQVNCKCMQNQRKCDEDKCKYKQFLKITRKKKIRKKQLKKKIDHKNIKVCLCKKSHCSKKYCQCYASGIACNIRCQCIECYNQALDRDEEQQGLMDGMGSSVLKKSEQGYVSEQSIGQFVQDNNFENMEMPEIMQFTNIDLKIVKQSS